MMCGMSQMHETADNSRLIESELDRFHKSMRLADKTAIALADDIGVHRNTVKNILKGRTRIDRRTRVAWAMATGVPVEWLATGTATGPGDTGTRLTHCLSAAPDTEEERRIADVLLFPEADDPSGTPEHAEPAPVIPMRPRRGYDLDEAAS